MNCVLWDILGIQTETQWVGPTRIFASNLCSWPKWIQRCSRPHNLSSPLSFGRTAPGNLNPPHVCTSINVSCFGKHGQAPLLSAAWLYRNRGFTQPGFHSRESKPGSSESWLHSFQYQMRKVRTEDRNKSAYICYLLHKCFSQSQESGERGLTCWQHVFPCILTRCTHRLDLKIYSLNSGKKGVCSLHYGTVPCISKS